ncbi:MAG: CPBP family intramembrane glutamic endopeptidase [Rhizomicrobium sp.]
MLTAPLYHGYTALDLVIVVLAVVVMPAMSALAGRKLAREAPDAGKLTPRYVRIILRGALFAVLVVAAWWTEKRPFAALGLAPHLSIWDYAGFGLAFLMGLVMLAQSATLASAPAEKVERAMKAVRSAKITPNTNQELALFMLMSVSAGIWEELVYRGFLIWFLVPLTGIAGAVAISAAIFGLGHIYQGVRGLVQTACVGLVFGTLYILTASLWWLMVLHAVVDMAGGITTFQVKRAAARRAPAGNHVA